MSEAKFTPGPWVLIEGQFDSEVEVTTETRQQNSKGEICGMDIYFDGSHGVEQPANAHLIAAAPEMYESIESDVIRLEFDLAQLGHGFAHAAEEINAELNAKKKLLAKARGEK